MSDQLSQRINARIRQIEANRVRVLKHFTPRYKQRVFILDCWCGLTFASAYIDTHDLERLIDWINEHAACAPKE